VAAAPSRARIIVVHGEPPVARELAERLREFGYDVPGAATTDDEALELARRTLPDLALVAAPGRGRRAAGAALDEQLGIPIVTLSEGNVDLRAALEGALRHGQLAEEHRNLKSLLERRAEHGDRLAALGALAGEVLREVDDPLSFVIGNQQRARSRLGALRELLDELEPSRRALALTLCKEIECAVSDAISGAERARTSVSELKKLSRPATVRAPSHVAPSTTPVAERARRLPRTQPPSPGCARLLFVDDEPILLDALARALEAHYAVDGAVSAQAALELFTAGNEYDLVVCDLMMPRMTGMDLFRALEQRFPSAARRTAFMTGGAFTLPAQEFIASAGRRVLEKPFTNAELFAFVVACLNVVDARPRALLS
jgi:CheY-like chemotaxis protein